MMSHVVHIPQETFQEIEQVNADGLFADPEAFVTAAVRHKLLDLRGVEFYYLTDGIRQGLQERGTTIQQTLDEIERLRHEDHHCR